MIRVTKILPVLPGLLFILTTSLLSAQEPLELKGTVTDQGGNPLPNVSISIEGSSVAGMTLTDSSGAFTIQVPEGDQWVLVNPADRYKPRRIYLNQRDYLQVRLVNEGSPSIADPVVMNNKISESRNLSASFSLLNVEKINVLPYETVDRHLSGQTSGIYSMRHSGKPGEGSYLSLRGFRSPFTNGHPLVVVDGMIYEQPAIFNPLLEGNIYSPLSSLEPLDITSITVLKDASAGAIYGFRGSNGVIMIETMKASETKTIIDLDTRFGMTFAPRRQPQLNNAQFRSLGHEILLSGGYEEEEMKEEFPGLFDDPASEEYHRFKHNTIWQDEVFRNGFLSDVMLRVKGGDANARYGFSFGYHNNQSIIKETYFQRYNLRFTGSLNILPWLNLDVNSNLNYNNSRIKETGASLSSPIFTALFKSPVMAPFKYDADGNQLEYYDDPSNFNVSNPMAIIDVFEGENDNYRLITSGRIYASVSDKLTLSALVGVNLNHLRETAFFPNEGMVPYFGGEVYNYAIHQVNHLKAIYNDNNLVYSPFNNRIHTLSIQGGFRLWTMNYEEDAGAGKNAHVNDQYKALQNGAAILREISGGNDNWNWMSVYGDVDYIFRDKYMLGINASFDGSSRTGKQAITGIQMLGTPFGAFYSLRAGWRLSNESWFRNLRWLDELKLRLSYGSAGNDDIGVYNSTQHYVSSHYRTASGLYLGTQPNPALKFETVNTLNAGLDMHLLGERFNLKFDLYNSMTEDMLIFERIESFFGFLYFPSNGGRVSNKGYDLSLNTGILRGSRFTWDLGFNLGRFNNTVEQVKGGEVVVDIPGGQTIIREGEAMNSFYGYIANGIFESTSDAEAAHLVNERGIPFSAGDVHFRDISGPQGLPDNVIDIFDKTIIGSPYPDLYGEVGTSLSYGRWTLSASLRFVVGNEVYNFVRYQNEKMEDLSNQSVSTLRRWVQEGQKTDIPRASWEDPLGNNAFSSRWIEDGSYLRLKHITLSYTIPEKIRIFRFAQVFVTGTNLFTRTSYLGFDPEFSVSWNQLEQGIDYGQVPITGSFLAGVKLGL